MQTPELSIVVPVYESGNIVEALVRAVAAAIPEIDYELILVNDCSPDESWTQICRAAEEDRRVRGLNLRKNVGQDRAIMAGLNYARGSYVVIMDDDLQHSPSDVPRLLDKVKQGYDVCYANFFQKKHKWYKNLGSWAAGKIAVYVLSKPNDVYMSPFKALRREIVSEIIRYRGPFPYIDGLLFQLTPSIAQVTVEHNTRASGESTHTIWKQVGLFLTLVTNFSILPLRVVTFLGGISSVLSFVLAVYFVAVYATVGVVVKGWTALVTILLFIGGLILISLGIIGEYIGRILLNVNQVPQFTVSGSVNMPTLGDDEGECL